MAGSRNKPVNNPVMEVVAECLQRNVLPKQTLAIGLSGGLDSMVLLHSAVAAMEKLDITLSAIHVHHGLSRNADKWAEHCISTCADWNLPLAIKRVDVPRDSGRGIEDAARRERHRSLSETAVDWIALAHHADDQAETLLLNLFRGAGLMGAAAMPERNGKLLRPLLFLPRSQLLTYAREHSLKWIEDESNQDVAYTRNYIRHQIFPALSERFPTAGTQLAAATRRFAEAQGLLEELARLDLGNQPPAFPLPLNAVRAISEVRTKNLLRVLLVMHGVQAPDERNLNEFVRQLQTAAPDRHPRLKLPDYELWVAKGALHFKTIAMEL